MLTLGDRRRIAVVSVLSVVVLALTKCSSDAPTATAPPTSGTPVTVSVSSPAPVSSRPTSRPPSASSSASPTTDPAAVRAKAKADVDAIIAAQPDGGVSVAALNMSTGAQFSGGQVSGMWTASAYKLFVLVTLLLQHQRSGSSLSDNEVSLATTMIENSNNVSAYSLFRRVGGRPGLAATAERLGMTHTIPGHSDPTFTTTSGSDYVVLLKSLVTPDSPLTPASQSFALGLMRQVETDQRWGVGAVADPGSTFANKNGWLSIDNGNGPGESDNGLWAVTSAGVVTVKGQQVLMAVFTRHQNSYDSGVALVEKIAKAAVPAVSS